MIEIQDPSNPLQFFVTFSFTSAYESEGQTKIHNELACLVNWLLALTDLLGYSLFTFSARISKGSKQEV